MSVRSRSAAAAAATAAPRYRAAEAPDPAAPAPAGGGRRTIALARLLVGGKYLSLVAGSLVTLVPLVVVLMASLKTTRESARSGPLVPPRDWLNLHNYVIAFTQGRMITAFVNTAIILAVSITGTVMIGSMTAYAIDRYRFPFRRLIISAFLLAALVPSVTTQVATFQIINRLGLFNTRGAPIALYLGTDIISIMIFVQFMRSIPVSLDEAARIDGASSLRIYWSIILPLLKPAIATVIIIRGIAIYNDFYVPFLYMPSDDLGVISTSLFRFKGPYSAHWEIICAGTVLVILPTLLAFLFLQRFIYNGLTVGAMK